MKDSRPVAGFVVLHYLALVSTLTCVSRILRQEDTGLDVRIVVVDNGSPNGSGERLRSLLADEPQVEVLFCEDNLGFARGNNAGYRRLLETCDPEFVVVLNNDVMLERDFLQRVAAEYERLPFAVLGPDVFVPGTGEHQSPSHVSIPTEAALEQMFAQHDTSRAGATRNLAGQKALAGARKVRHAAGQFLRKTPLASIIWKDKAAAAPTAQQAPVPVTPLYMTPQENVVLHGACYVFSRAFTSVRAEAFCPDTFLYLEEDILAYECLRDGLPMRYEPSIQVMHQEDTATNLAYPSQQERHLLKLREKGASAGVLLRKIRQDRARLLREFELEAVEGTQLELVSAAYASRSTNSAAFRREALASFVDAEGVEHRFAAFADERGHVRLATSRDGQPWENYDTHHTLDLQDAHNAPSLAVDGEGRVHLAWSTHNSELTYLRGIDPLSSELEALELPGTAGKNITYPEFHLQPSGDLLLLYRNGRAGSGSAELLRYSASAGSWEELGELLRGGDESPYWQACVDNTGCLHISWCWRACSDAGTNHDICYLRSTDASCTQFVDDAGTAVELPATASLAPVWELPQGSGLVNQTSMAVLADGTPVVAGLWRSGGAMQYQLLMRSGEGWSCTNTGIRTTDFPLSGRGTRRMGCARPRILVQGTREQGRITLLLRDDERCGVASVATFALEGDEPQLEGIRDLTRTTLGAWEPNCDLNLWQRAGRIRMLAQRELGAQDNREFPSMAAPLYVAETNA